MPRQLKLATVAFPLAPCRRPYKNEKDLVSRVRGLSENKVKQLAEAGVFVIPLEDEAVVEAPPRLRPRRAAAAAAGPTAAEQQEAETLMQEKAEALRAEDASLSKERATELALARRPLPSPLPLAVLARSCLRSHLPPSELCVLERACLRLAARV